MLVDRLIHVPTNFQMYRQNSEKAPPPPSLPTGYANGWQCQGSRYMIWGICARSARKFKELVCLVVLLCWIKRFVLLSLCLNANIWIDIFHAFKNRGGDDPPPRKIRGGDTSPPSPPGSPEVAEETMWKCESQILWPFTLVTSCGYNMILIWLANAHRDTN